MYLLWTVQRNYLIVSSPSALVSQITSFVFYHHLITIACMQGHIGMLPLTTGLYFSSTCVSSHYNTLPSFSVPESPHPPCAQQGSAHPFHPSLSSFIIRRLLNGAQLLTSDPFQWAMGPSSVATPLCSQWCDPFTSVMSQRFQDALRLHPSLLRSRFLSALRYHLLSDSFGDHLYTEGRPQWGRHIKFYYKFILSAYS